MTGFEIKQKIDQKNKELEEMISPGTFTLNKAAKAIIEEIEALKESCPHEFKNGQCIYCYRGESE